jgi:putative ABC transport system permease protein
MIRNYIKIVLRNIFRNKLSSIVNILGLTFGMASALLIFLWVNDEVQVDQFHSNGRNLYQVLENQQYGDGKLYTFRSTPGPMAPFVKEKFPEIELATRYTWNVGNLFQVGDKSFNEDGRWTDQDFLHMFSFPVIAGDPGTALKERNSIVLTEKLARKYFGDDDAIGKIITLNTTDAFQVTAVLADLPKNSSLQFDYLLPFEKYFEDNKQWLDQWGNNNIRTYLQLAEGTDLVNFDKKFRHEIREHNEDTNVELFVQPFGEVYLRGEFEEGKQSGGRIEYVQIFFVVAIFVLGIACINFTNLSTAQASRRAKEVGLRKVIGAIPRQLFRQFMSESFLTVIIAALIGILLTVLVLPYFNDLTGKTLSLNLLDTRIVLIFLLLIFSTAILAGSYPAIFISEFKPVQVLKGQLRSGRMAAFFRKTLVTIQFSLSIILIVSTVVVYRQMQFMQDRDIGFVRDNVFYSWMAGDMAKNYKTIRDRLMNESSIEAVTMSSQLPIDIGNSTMGLDWEGKDPELDILFTNLDVDFEFIQTMKMEMADGRPFDRSIITDTVGYIVNETGAEKFGFADGIVAGKDLTMWDRKGKIVGVVKDFNFGSLHSPIDPLIMRVARRVEYGALLVRAREGRTTEAIKALEGMAKEYAAAYPFQFSFLNQDWEDYYKAEGQRGKIFNALSVLSIFISCLGLFGLSAFSAQRRVKELGIRKVLGASVPGLLQLMSAEFTLLVIVASFIGCPLAWYVMNGWLTNYAYHVDVGWLTLVVAAFTCLAVSLLTILYHSLRATLANPAHSLRYE